MKKKILLISTFSLILFMGISFALDPDSITDNDFLKFANASEYDKYNEGNVLLNQIPDPAEPGSYVEIRFKLENLGGAKSKDVTVEILPKYPFSLEQGDSQIRKVGSLYSRQIGEYGVVVYYKLRIDKNAVEGKNQIYLRYMAEENGGWHLLGPYEIRLQTHDSILSVESSITEPEIIKPGDNAKLKLKLKNSADSIIQDIKVKLDLSSVPFATIGSTNEKSFYQMGSKEETEIEFNLVAESDASSKVYKIPIDLRYSDYLGNNYVKNTSFGVLVGASPELVAILESSDIYKAKSKGNIVFKFINKGLAKIKFLNVKIGNNNDFELLSPSEVYVGNIDSDDYETFESKIYLKDTKKERIIFPLALEYYDSNNKKYSEEVKLELKLFSEKEAKEIGLSKENKYVGVVITILIVVVGLLIYWFFLRRKDKGH